MPTPLHLNAAAGVEEGRIAGTGAGHTGRLMQFRTIDLTRVHRPCETRKYSSERADSANIISAALCLMA